MVVLRVATNVVDSVDDDRVVGVSFCFFQAEDGIRDLVRSRGLGDVYKRQSVGSCRFLRMST